MANAAALRMKLIGCIHGPCTIGAVVAGRSKTLTGLAKSGMTEARWSSRQLAGLLTKVQFRVDRSGKRGTRHISAVALNGNVGAPDAT